MIGVTSFGSYIPRLRLSRKAIAEANGWMEPSPLMGKECSEATE
jgi:3-hydroxy-3-methylglutaryl CoA synthase